MPHLGGASTDQRTQARSLGSPTFLSRWRSMDSAPGTPERASSPVPEEPPMQQRTEEVAEFIRGDDGTPLFYRRVRCKAPKKCSIMVLHGAGSHSGGLLRVAQRLSRVNSAEVHMFDLRGHGQSGGVRGDGDIATMMSDMRVVHKLMEPGLPCFLYGHCLGGLLVLCYVLRYGEQLIDGIVCSSPLLQLQKEVPRWKLWMMRLGFGALDEFQISVFDPFCLCDIPQYCARLLVDPLWQQQMTVQLAHEILTCADIVMGHADRISVPLLMLHGDRDTVSSHEATGRFWKQVQTNTKRLMLVAGGFHELHNDQKGEEWVHQIASHLAKWVAESVHVGTRSWKDIAPDSLRPSLGTLRKANVNSWLILAKRNKYLLLTLFLLYIVCGLIKLKFGRTSLPRVLFWPSFVTWWASQKALDYVDRPLTL